MVQSLAFYPEKACRVLLYSFETRASSLQFAELQFQRPSINHKSLESKDLRNLLAGPKNPQLFFPVLCSDIYQKQEAEYDSHTQ